jgi:predicted amidohydrolase
MMSACSIAVAQTVPARGDVAANLEQHVRLARIASAEGAQVVVFPELSLTGYEMDLAESLGFSETDSRLTPLIDLASSLSIILIAGAPVRLGPRLHIGALILTPERRVEVYTKQHLGAFSASAARGGIVPPAEATVFSPGDRNPLVRVGDRTAGVAVCADTGRPSHARSAAERGASIYLASMFVIPSEFERETASLGEYARRHSMAVGFANYGGPSGGLASGGRSAIWSETGGCLISLPPSGAGVAVARQDRGGWRVRTIVPGDS